MNAPNAGRAPSPYKPARLILVLSPKIYSLSLGTPYTHILLVQRKWHNAKLQPMRDAEKGLFVIVRSLH